MSFYGGRLPQAITSRRVLDDPVLFSQDILGVELWSKQREILGALWDGQDVDVQSCQRGRKDEGRCGGYARVGGSSGQDRAPHPDAAVGSGLGTSSDQSGPVRVCAKRDLTQRSTIVPLCLRVTFLLNVARVRHACTRYHPRSSRRSPRGPTGRRHCSSQSCSLVAPPDNRLPRDDVRGSNDPLLPAPALASATARRGLRMSQGRSGKAAGCHPMTAQSERSGRVTRESRS